MVTAIEIAGFLKPPPASCAAPTVAGSGGHPTSPQGLPEYRAGDPKLLPLGIVAIRDGDWSVGVRGSSE